MSGRLYLSACNILMSEVEGLFTLSNRGLNQNCSLTTLLFPANFKVLDMKLHAAENEVSIIMNGKNAISTYMSDAQKEINLICLTEMLLWWKLRRIRRIFKPQFQRSRGKRNHLRLSFGSDAAKRCDRLVRLINHSIGIAARRYQ